MTVRDEVKDVILRSAYRILELFTISSGLAP